MTTHTSAGKRSDGAMRSSGFHLGSSPSHLLRRAQQFSTEIFVRAGFADGVTLRQTVVLAAIADAEGESQSKLVRATGVDRSTLADMIARMEKRGLVARSASRADGRAKSVRLTEAGRRQLGEALPALKAVDDTLMAALPKNRRKAFSATLGALAEAANDAGAIERAERKSARKAEKARAQKDSKRRKKK